ncbi:MAG: NAD(P)-dependent oxidoreductase [Armatimonadetes bacterium]|nr:NAD(P)-dependent oxidoreductase [Armatimonadota bacterium]
MIYVIGGGGFVGSAFCAHCEREGLDYRCITRQNYEQFAGGTCDVLVNANGNSKKFLAREQPTVDFELSVASVNRTIADFTCGCYIYLSSIDVYPSCETPDQATEETVIDPEVISPYGLHKYMAEWLVRRHVPRWVIFRLGGMLGPGLKKNPVFDLLHGEPLRVDPESRYQYVDTATVAAVVLALHDHHGEIYNLCGVGTVSPEELAREFDLPLSGGGEKQVYEASNDKIRGLVELPQSRAVAMSYVAEELERAG